jgi:hypothetical protein
MQLATWAQTLPVILMIVLAVYLPGSIVGLLAGRRGVDLVALAPVISIAIAGVGGVVVYPLGVRWGWGAYLLGAALVALVVFATRTTLAHVRGQSHAWWPGEAAALRPAGTAEVTSAAEPTGSARGRLSWLPATTGVAVALTTIAVRFIRAVPLPDQVTQNYDSVFHDNIVARIIITGEASSLHALPPIRDVYPIAFQQFAALGALAVPHTTATAAVTAAWPIVAIALICWAARYLCDRYGQADFVRLPTHGLLRNAAWAVALLVVLAACTVNPQLDGMQRSVAGTYAFAADNSDNPMLSDDEYLLLKRIGRSVPEHEQVISDPWNGSGFLLAVGWRTPFYPHLSMMWDHDHDYLARNLHAIDTDPEVCAIIRRNDLHWYLDMGGSFAPNDPQHAMFTGMRAVPDAMQAVDRQGRATLYRITACWAGE